MDKVEAALEAHRAAQDDPEPLKAEARVLRMEPPSSAAPLRAENVLDVAFAAPLNLVWETGGGLKAEGTVLGTSDSLPGVTFTRKAYGNRPAACPGNRLCFLFGRDRPPPRPKALSR